MPDLIYITCPDCGYYFTSDFFDFDFLCPYCGNDLYGINFIVSNIDLDDEIS